MLLFKSIAAPGPARKWPPTKDTVYEGTRLKGMAFRIACDNVTRCCQLVELTTFYTNSLLLGSFKLECSHMVLKHKLTLKVIPSQKIVREESYRSEINAYCVLLLEVPSYMMP